MSHQSAEGQTTLKSAIDLAIGGCFAAMLLFPSFATAQIAGKKGPCHRVTDCPSPCNSFTPAGAPSGNCRFANPIPKYGTTCGNCQGTCAATACSGGWNPTAGAACTCTGVIGGVNFSGTTTC